MTSKTTIRTSATDPKLIESIYDAAFRPEGWPAIVENLRKTANACFGWMPFAPREEPELTYWTDPGFSRDVLHDYMRHYWAQDVWTEAWMARPDLWNSYGKVVLLDELIDRKAFLKSEFYNDCTRRVGVDKLCGITLSDESHPWIPRMVLSLLRSPNAESFTGHDQTKLEPYVPHLVRGIDLHFRLRHANAVRGASLAVLDRLPVGVVLLDANGRVMHCNAAAERLLSYEGCNAAIRERRLVGATPDQTAALERLCGQAVATSVGLGESAGGAVELGDPTRGHTLDALVCPLPGQHPLADGTRRAAALVFLSDPTAERTLSHDVLRQLFGLTAAEAGVAEGIANGMTPDELADARGTDRDTVRGQLQIAFQKTGTRRQAELAKAVLSSAAGLPGPTGLRGVAGVIGNMDAREP